MMPVVMVAGSNVATVTRYIGRRGILAMSKIWLNVFVEEKQVWKFIDFYKSLDTFLLLGFYRLSAVAHFGVVISGSWECGVKDKQSKTTPSVS